MAEREGYQQIEHLASYRRCIARIQETWPTFHARRIERLRQGLFGAPAEKVAENILEDLFTQVLDWQLGDVNLQVDRADMLLSDNGIKQLVVEVKRPGALAWHGRTVRAALEQAMRYAAEQKVKAVAVSDGDMLYAADLEHGGLRDRLLANLASPEPPLGLWWLSVHGIYRHPGPLDAPLLPESSPTEGAPLVADDTQLHPKYGLPASCFAYVESAVRPQTWKLPYRLADGTPDAKRLPKAIAAILSNYRGTKVQIPRDAVPDVLVRLAKAAADLGKMPCQTQPPAEVYREAHHALDQLGRLAEVGCCRA